MKEKPTAKYKHMHWKKYIESRKFPRPTCSAIIQNAKNEILLVRRTNTPYNRHWVLPGGHVDMYLTVEHTIKKEVAEETGLKVRSMRFFGYYDEIIRGMGWHCVVMVFSAKTSGNLKKATHETSDAGFFSLAQIRKMKIGFNHMEIIKDFFRRKGK